MIQIMKASAGSGKTYNLAEIYIRLLLGSKDPYAYRHILAVTFTNKATEEMKSRILKELAKRAETDGKARQALVSILHDYGAFSISTIDKFFQQALKAFSREIGQFASYQVELDRESLIHEAVDRILDSLEEQDRDMLDWVRSLAMEDIEKGRKFSAETNLYAAGERLKSGEFANISERQGIDPSVIFSKENLKRIRRNCDKVIKSFTERLKDMDSSYLDRFAPGEKITVPNKTQLKQSPELAGLFGDPYREYLTAFIIRSQSTSLGIARELDNEFKALLKEKNVLSLDDSNTILKGIIDGCDAPFIYEKLGVRFEHFLLDEFQDTSTIQWENFLPLLRESDANGNENLIVGDVKQSIYRWRSSDWNLLASKLGQQFPDAVTKVLENNWRSAAEIVNFNNAFYNFAADALDKKIAGKGGGLSIKDIYSDVSQGIMSKDSQRGYVEVSFVGKDEMLDCIEDSVRSALRAGALPGDIAILVRGHGEGGELASHLISHGIRVISDDSLKLLSSVTVRRLISLLSSIDSPQDTVSTYLAEALCVEYPTEYHSLADLCESLLRSLKDSDTASFEGEVLYIQTFMDALQDWTSVNGNNLKLFLEYIKDADLKISSPDDSNAVTVMTIHKSKGLEFPYVIFPYAQKVNLYKHGEHWCKPSSVPSSLEQTADGIYPVDLTKDTESTFFDEALFREQKLQAVDNLNIFYVATTRASCSLHIISENPSGTLVKALEKGTDADYKSMSDILYAFCKGRGTRFGTEYDFTSMERKDENGGKDFNALFHTIGLDGRLGASDDAYDFFGEEGCVGASASARLNGIALHEILSRTTSPHDLDGAVEEITGKGIITAEEGHKAKELLSARIASHPEWFGTGEDLASVSNETTIFAEDGTMHRPDRVIVRNGEVQIVDYKFGERKNSYLRQVSGYMQLYRSLGYSSVRGFLWYVPEDSVEEVIC